jgi:hypothetical protein
MQKFVWPVVIASKTVMGPFPSLKINASQKFFFGLTADPTNQPPVRQSQIGYPLGIYNKTG